MGALGVVDDEILVETGLEFLDGLELGAPFLDAEVFSEKRAMQTPTMPLDWGFDPRCPVLDCKWCFALTFFGRQGWCDVRPAEREGLDICRIQSICTCLRGRYTCAAH